MRTLIKGERDIIGATVNRRSGDSFTITIAEYWIKDSKGTIIESGNCFIEEPTVYFVFDTDQPDVKSGKHYQAFLAVEVDESPIRKKNRQEIKVE